MKEIRITSSAKSDLEKITEHLIEEWGEKFAIDFLDRFDELCILIAQVIFYL